MIPQHLSLTNEHPTPAHVVELARKVMGCIDLDPASSVIAQQTVKALNWIGLPRDGLEYEWRGSVFLNPPGGTTPDRWRKVFMTKSNACAWWRRLVEQYEATRTVTEAIFVGFTLELLRSTQGGFEHWAHPFDFTICVPLGGASENHSRKDSRVSR